MGRRQPPFGIIWPHLKAGELVCFLGAGASRTLPNPAMDAGLAGDQLPGGAELARQLADESSFPSSDKRDRSDLLKVASYYQEQGDRDSLRKRLRNIFVRRYPWGKVHEFLASIEPNLFIVTTNYDDLIEQAFDHRKKPYHLVVHGTDQGEHAASVLWWAPGAKQPTYSAPSELKLRPVQDGTIIYKMHGTVNQESPAWDSFVITEDDYIDFLARMTAGSAVPAKFKAYFRRARFLYLGYGLADWNLRVMLKNFEPKNLAGMDARISGSQMVGGMRAVDGVGVAPDSAPSAPVSPDATPRKKSWAIQYKPSELELTLWRARQVDIYDMTVDEFIAGLADVVDAERGRAPQLPGFEGPRTGP